MNIFELKVWDDEGARCTFYTVQQQDDPENETDKFFAKYEEAEGLEEQIGILLSFVLDSIGNDHGALDALFNRNENEVKGLPAQGKVRIGEVMLHFPNFPLRLYALKITDELVVLFNGGVKDGPTNQQSSLYIKWIEACQFAKRIMEALVSKEILVDERNRKLTDGTGGNDLAL
ncbi:hypothetical protein [Rufibacter quisquiliarum]|uniref:Uncharacterized protein n=1 Tax=Rufibacter quisquiliarum TaxID=1549639 RepID=A0A839GN67_9BACT|nr:hypothetical protein [Rufibacter quisquiliarum]MBA9078259.1 hypothetical protein [Rufibacter quisquiliarum]